MGQAKRHKHTHTPILHTHILVGDNNICPPQWEMVHVQELELPIHIKENNGDSNDGKRAELSAPVQVQCARDD